MSSRVAHFEWSRHGEMRCCTAAAITCKSFKLGRLSHLNHFLPTFSSTECCLESLRRPVSRVLGSRDFRSQNKNLGFNAHLHCANDLVHANTSHMVSKIQQRQCFWHSCKNVWPMRSLCMPLLGFLEISAHFWSRPQSMDVFFVYLCQLWLMLLF